MSFLAPIMLFGWLPITLIFFKTMPPRKAILFSVIGGVLFLPMSKIALPGLSYNKSSAVGISLLIGNLFTTEKDKKPFIFESYDFLMLISCIVSPFGSSLLNGLGLYDGFTSMLKKCLTWGVFYWAGRKYFTDKAAIKDLCIAIIIGGLIYIPFCLYEIRFSPKLSLQVYGFMSHSFLQHVRYGHFRPLVFMKHGLMVSLWIAVSATISFWLWRSKNITHINKIPISLIVAFLFIMTILTRSSNAMIFMILGVICWFITQKTHKTFFIVLVLLTIPAYIITRANNIIPIGDMELFMSRIFDEERIRSLVFRLRQEDLFSVKAFLKPFFGWGGWNRGRPIDPQNGKIIEIVDALWVILFSQNGLVGLISFFSSILIGPWLVLRKYKKNYDNQAIYPIVLSLCLIFFMIDSLQNAMVNSVYILSAGALVSYHISTKKNPIKSEIKL